MATFNNGESGLSVRTKINNVLQHADGTASELVINDAGADINFRVESDTNANALFVDGGTGNVGIGTGAPSRPLDVNGAVQATDYRAPASSVFFVTGDEVRVRTTGGAERMRIDASGNLLVGATFLGGQGGLVVQPNISNGGASLLLNRADTANTTVAVYFRNNGVNVGNISYNNTSTAYNTSSDYRLKEDVQPMVGASDRVLSLNPVNFAWKADGSRTDGFIAHEAQAVAPYAVTGEKDGEDMQGMDHSKLVPLLTAALQEALQRIAALEAQLKP